MRSFFILLSTSILFATNSYAGFFSSEESKKNEPEFIYDCKADREFITSYEYLKKETVFGLNPPEMRTFALSVAGGCTGAAGNFIEMSQLLLKAHVDAKQALIAARDVAIKGENASKAFIKIFKSAFAKDVFDLDVAHAVRVAKRLSLEFKGNPDIAAADFQDLATFCVSDLGRGLPRANCAKVVENTIIANEDGKLAVAGAFKEIFEFLTRRDETNLTPADALAIAEKLCASTPNSIDVFRKAFEYAQDKSGLGLSRGEAAQFATAVAIQTKQKKQ